MLSFACETTSGNPFIKPLVFDWDEATGAISGPSAVTILTMAREGGVSLHPHPSYHAFGAEPLKSRTDLAAMVVAVCCWR